MIAPVVWPTFSVFDYYRTAQQIPGEHEGASPRPLCFPNLGQLWKTRPHQQGEKRDPWEDPPTPPGLLRKPIMPAGSLTRREQPE